MTRAQFNQIVRRLHLWLALAIGAQVVIWLASGLFMTLFAIEEVRGEHLRAEDEAVALAWPEHALDLTAAVEASGLAPSAVSAQMLDGRAVWRIADDAASVMVDALTGEVITPLSEERARRIAQSAYLGEGAVAAATLFDDPPQEYGRAGPVWRIDFARPDAASFYVDASTGAVRAVRTGLWRAFDFMWGLHIMDWSSRENFNSWWIKMTASLAFVFALAGVCLTGLRVANMLRSRR